jgi:hypothetical protein
MKSSFDHGEMTETQALEQQGVIDVIHSRHPPKDFHEEPAARGR